MQIAHLEALKLDGGLLGPLLELPVRRPLVEAEGLSMTESISDSSWSTSTSSSCDIANF